MSAARKQTSRSVPAKRRPRSYHHGDLRRALVEETVRLIEEQDVDAVSLREVARRLGVTYAAPYHHFHDKGALLAAVAEDGFRALLGAVQEGLRGSGSAVPASLLAVAGRAYIQFATTHQAHYRTMFLPEFRERERFASLHEAGGQALDALVSLVSAARPHDSTAGARALAVACWSSWHGFAMLTNNGVLSSHPDLRTAETLLWGLLAFVEHAVRAAPPAPAGPRAHPQAESGGTRPCRSRSREDS